MSEIYRSEGNLLTETINKKISRRSFLKWSAAIGATTSVAGLISQKNKKADATFGSAGPVSSTQMNWMPTTCLVCHGWDAKAIGIDGNKCVKKIEGMGGQKSTFSCDAVPEGGTNIGYDPDLRGLQSAQTAGSLRYYPGTRGKICAKGSNGMEHMYDPDRIKFPLLRTGRRGVGTWARISWKEALRRTARAIIDARGTKATALSGTGYASGNDWISVGDPNGTLGIDSAAKRSSRNVVHWRGRDELGIHAYNSRFNKALGANSVAHTSLCEVSRHAAYATVYDHHFPMPDAHNHENPVDDCDIMVEFGGNGVEQKIPAYMTAQSWGDRRARGCRIVSADPRQSNSSAFADEWIKMRPGTDGALAIAICHTIMTADSTVIGGGYTQAGTLTFGTSFAPLVTGPTNFGHAAGQWGWDGTGFQGGTYANQGGSGALEGYAVGTTGYTKWAADNVVGLYPYDEEPTVTDPWNNSSSSKIPTKESLLSYVRNAEFATLEGGAVERDKNWGAAITGLDAGTIVYLAQVFGHQDAGSGAYKNPQWNCYRGPAKHTNGTYATKAGECLNILSGSTHKIGCGNSRHNWPDDTQYPNNSGDGLGNVTGSTGGSSADAGDEFDRWDFVNGRKAYYVNYAGVDQNLAPSLRVACGIDSGIAPSYAYATAAARTTHVEGGTKSGPATAKASFAPKTIILFKNAPTQTRGDKGLEEELFLNTWSTATDPYDGGLEYKIKHLISIDINMGDGTRFCDIILPDGSYLERHDVAIIHTHAFASFSLLRQPVLRAAYPPVYSNHDILTLHRAHEVQSIMRGIALALDVEYACIAGVAATTTLGTAKGNTGNTPAQSFFWGTHNTYPAGLQGAYNNVASPDVLGDIQMMKDIDDAVDNYWLALWGGSFTKTTPTGAYAGYAAQSPGDAGGRTNTTTVWSATSNIQYAIVGTAEQKYNWMMQNGTFWATPHEALANDGKWVNWNNFFRGSMNGGKRSTNNWGHMAASDANSKISVYSHVHGRYSWSLAAPTKFYGGPRYIPIETVPGTYTIGSTDTHYPLQHTTMKRNVHTQSRTAALPRLMEILGSNPMWINPTNATALSLSDGDLVKVYLPRLSRGSNLSTGNSRVGATGPKTGAANRPAWADSEAVGANNLTWDAENYYVVRVHVTPRMMADVVATSCSFGHSVSRDGAIDAYGQTAFGTYTATGHTRGVNGTTGTTSTSTGTSTSTTSVTTGITLRSPSAPGAGWNPNWGLHRLTDTLGCSLAWFDNVCRIVKL